MNLPYLLSQWQGIRDQLLADFPDIDAETLADTLDGETGALDAVASLIRRSREDEASADAVRVLAKQYQERASRLDARSRAGKNAATKLMQALEVRKVERPEFTASFRAIPRRPIITDLNALPDRCVTVETVKKPNVDEIKRLLDDGTPVPGATMSNGGESLTVRVR